MLSSSITLKSEVQNCVGHNKNGWKPIFVQPQGQICLSFSKGWWLHLVCTQLSRGMLWRELQWELGCLWGLISVISSEFPLFWSKSCGWRLGDSMTMQNCCVCVLQQVSVLDQRLQLHRVLLLQVVRERGRGQSWDHPEPEEILCQPVLWLASFV